MIILPKGVAFPFIRRFLKLNMAFPEQEPVEVVLMSKNSPETGLSVFRSIQHYNLNITRAVFYPVTPLLNIFLPTMPLYFCQPMRRMLQMPLKPGMRQAVWSTRELKMMKMIKS